MLQNHSNKNMVPIQNYSHLIFDKDINNRMGSSTNGNGKTGSLHTKNKSPHTNTNFKLFENINVKLKTLKLLDEKSGTTHADDRAS